MGSFSIWHLLIILIIVLVFFGAQRLPDLGNSLGKAIRGFKEGLSGESEEEKAIRTAKEALTEKDSRSQTRSEKTRDRQDS